MHRWILASRPKTLTAAIAPVILGSSLAFQEGYFSFLIFIIILITAILIQIGTNFVNDLFDYIPPFPIPYNTIDRIHTAIFAVCTRNS